MNSVKVNILANFIGQSWSALMQLAFLPLYLKFLGIEAYGLIGFYIMLQGILQVLDLGLGPTINREMARYSAQPDKAGEARDLARTLEIGYWLIGIVIGVTLLAAAPWIAAHWMRAQAIPVTVVAQAAMMMGVLAALQGPLTFYQAGLMGLQRQVLLNGLKIVMITLSRGGVVLILWLVSPSIVAFFAWQVVVSAVYVALVTISLWRCLPAPQHKPRVDLRLVARSWRFAAGMGGITVSAMILTQLDKLILSKMLSLEMFGYYTLASVVGYGLVMVIAPVFSAIFPRFSSLLASADEATLKRLYHQGAQLLAVILLPLAAVIAFFSFDILLLWTGNVETATNASPIVSLLVIGTAMNGLMNLPYALQLAHGWTSIGLRINVLLIIMLVPVIFFMTRCYGATGAATVWVASQAVYVLIGVPLTHTRLLRGEARRWFAEDVGLPLAGALLVVMAGRWLIASPMASTTAIASLSLVLLGSLAAAALATPQTRGWLATRLSERLVRA